MEIFALAVGTGLVVAARAVMATGRQMEQHTRNVPPKAFTLAPSESGAFRQQARRAPSSPAREPS